MGAEPSPKRQNPGPGPISEPADAMPCSSVLLCPTVARFYARLQCSATPCSNSVWCPAAVLSCALLQRSATPCSNSLRCPAAVLCHVLLADLAVGFLRFATPAALRCYDLQKPKTLDPMFLLCPAAVLCYALLADLALSFLRSLVSAAWRDRGLWAHSEAAEAAAQLASAAVRQAAAVHDDFLSARDPVLTLKVRRQGSVGKLSGPACVVRPWDTSQLPTYATWQHLPQTATKPNCKFMRREQNCCGARQFQRSSHIVGCLNWLQHRSRGHDWGLNPGTSHSPLTAMRSRLRNRARARCLTWCRRKPRAARPLRRHTYTLSTLYPIRPAAVRRSAAACTLGALQSP